MVIHFTKGSHQIQTIQEANLEVFLESGEDAEHAIVLVELFYK